LFLDPHKTHNLNYI